MIYDKFTHKNGDNVNVIIEIPQYSQNKYEVDEETGIIKLDRVIYAAFAYPANYGFVPQTLAEDGDHLDCMVYSSHPLMSGCLVEARPIGFMKMIDGGEEDHKIIAVPKADARFNHVKTLADIGDFRPQELQHFFENLKTLQNKKVEVLGFEGVDKAMEALERCHQAFLNK